MSKMIEVESVEDLHEKTETPVPPTTTTFTTPPESTWRWETREIAGGYTMYTSYSTGPTTSVIKGSKES